MYVCMYVPMHVCMYLFVVRIVVLLRLPAGRLVLEKDSGCCRIYYTYIYIHMCISIYIDRYLHTHTYIHTYVHTNIGACECEKKTFCIM